ncbi:MAG: hypothetical protein ACYC18_04365 [Gammaproteobacteria bacterium]|nr:hypothetical protein [Gammaproteobacteria bacterium]
MIQRQPIEQLVQADFRLIAIETTTPDRVMEMFRSFSQRTGKAVYHWTAEDGMFRLGGFEHIIIPHTQRALDVLDYIASNSLYGVYLLRGIMAPLQDKRCIAALRRIAEAQDGTPRLIVLLDEKVSLPAELRDLSARVKHGLRKVS